MGTRVMEFLIDGMRLRSRLGRSRVALALGLSFVALLAQGCGGSALPTVPDPTPAPTPTPGLSTAVVLGPRTGLTEITFVAAEPPPGSTLTGCGSSASGCNGRVRMRFRLLSASGDRGADAIAYLHTTGKLACYSGRSGLNLQPGVAKEVVIVFDQADAAACRLPATIANMKVVLSASPGVAALQEWAVQYEFRP